MKASQLDPRNMGEWLRSALSPLVRQFGYGLGTVFFIPNPWVGLVFWVALFAVPRHGWFALLGLCIGTAIKYLLRLDRMLDLGGGVKANALLAAVAASWLVSALDRALWVDVSIAVVAAMCAAILSAAAQSVLRETRFPSMVIGYCIVASGLFVLCPDCTVSAAARMVPWLPPASIGAWIESFLKSLGALVYSPSVPFGILVCSAMLIWSRAAFLCGIVAWLCGVLVSQALSDLGYLFFYLPLSYNYFMVGVALGAVLFLPGPRGLVIAALAGCVCALIALCLQVILSGGAVSYLPLSSMLTVWTGCAAISVNGHPLLHRYASSRFPPELAWFKASYFRRRFGRPDPLLAVPLSCPVRIVQGFAGGVTHVGRWQHALDFQSADDSASGYGIWGAPVLAPGPGIVERIKSDLPDNPIGGSDFHDNWGNYVVIRLEGGGWILLGHLMQGSVCVTVGSYVATGAVVGRVGNSGRSPVPHLHLQLQETSEPGAPTRPFKLANFLQPGPDGSGWKHWQSSAVPEEGQCILAALSNPGVYELLTRMMPGSAVWFCEAQGDLSPRIRHENAMRSTRIQTTLDEAGCYRLDSGHEGRLIAALDPDAWRISELERVKSSLLGFLGLAIPCVPYAVQQGMTWEDVPPVPVQGLGLLQSFAPFFGYTFPRGRYRCAATPDKAGGLLIEAEFDGGGPEFPVSTSCRIEPLRGPTTLKVNFPGGALEFVLLSFEPGLPGSVEKATESASGIANITSKRAAYEAQHL